VRQLHAHDGYANVTHVPMAADPLIGSTVSHYRVLSRLGTGGMGAVYLAEDLQLNRKVALKFLSGSDEPEARLRLLREAQTASALDHPNIETIHEVSEWRDRPFIVMGYCPGETLRARLQRGTMAVGEIVDVASQIAVGLAAAHASGVVHRDLKPANVMIAPSGQVRILDFGLAKASSGESDTMTRLTREGTTLGTLAYMSPEQAQGLAVDERTDIWSFGVVLYEMLAGRPPFDERSAAALLLALVSSNPPPIVATRPDTPPELRRIVDAALERAPATRMLTAARIHEELLAYRAQLSASRPAPATASPRVSRRTVAVVVGALALAGASGAWLLQRWLNERWALREALPEIARLANEERFAEAMELAHEAARYIPGNRQLASLVNVASRRITFETAPPAARVSFATYGGNSVWTPLGETPLRAASVPNGLLRWRIEKEGFTTFEDAMSSDSHVLMQLIPAAEAPKGMVRASGARAPAGTVVSGRLLPRVTFPDFWIDRYEVTNRQYLAFVEAGGYQKPDYWRHPLHRDGVTLTWGAAMAHFRDQTGRAGPATWVLGRHREGDGDLPVTGVSWYEAAAYAAYAGKDLPTVYHWNHVGAHEELRAQVIPLANFAGQLLLPVGRTSALHRFGAYDLAGNVKEWVFNESAPGERYSLGGAWNEPPYLFVIADARSAWERQGNFGFRCVRYGNDRSFLPPLITPIPPPTRDYSREQPVRDELFQAYARLYSYDRSPLDARTEMVDQSPADWIRETVSFRAAYGSERMQAHVFLPKRGKPPFQAAVFAPGANALDVRSSRDEVESPSAEFVARGGRALIVPVLRGTFERSTPDLRSDTSRESNAFRDLVIDWSKDLGRTIDYLQTRSDVACDKLAYLGISRGAAVAPVLLALEPRVRVAVLYIPGFYAHRLAPEVDVINFAPRMTIPTLVLNGRYDFLLPAATSQEPFFRALGAPAAHKRRVVYDTGHDLPRTEMIKETLEWLDKYLGPVE
jgi:eukaryotic-like serine/threonine-protein kinase